MAGPDNTEIAVALSRMQDMSSDLQEIKSTMKELAQAVSRLAVVEERQANTNDSIDRAFKEIKALGARVTSLEAAQPLQQQTSDWVQSGVKYIMAAVLGAILAGFLRTPPAMPQHNPPAITGK